MKDLLQRFPFLVRFIIRFKELFLGKEKFKNSREYWSNRYRNNGNSGSGSYDHLAEFKAEIINEFVKQSGSQTVIEFGCGDGNQLRYLEIPSYLGVDVSSEAINMCEVAFATDTTKKFLTIEQYHSERQADLTMSLDVIYHLIEDDVFEGYMSQLFDSAKRFVIIYSSNEDKPQVMDHVRSRKFSTWVEENRSDFELVQFIPNRHAIGTPGNETKSIADFYIYQLRD